MTSARTTSLVEWGLVSALSGFVMHEAGTWYCFVVVSRDAYVVVLIHTKSTTDTLTQELNLNILSASDSVTPCLSAHWAVVDPAKTKVKQAQFGCGCIQTRTTVLPGHHSVSAGPAPLVIVLWLLHFTLSSVTDFLALGFAFYLSRSSMSERLRTSQCSQYNQMAREVSQCLWCVFEAGACCVAHTETHDHPPGCWDYSAASSLGCLGFFVQIYILAKTLPLFILVMPKP